MKQGVDGTDDDGERLRTRYMKLGWEQSVLVSRIMDTVCNAAKIWRLFKVIRTIPDEESVSWSTLRPRFSKFCTIAGFARIITKQLFEEC